MRLFEVIVIAVPLPADYVAWKGRYCAFDQTSYDHFMKYVMAQVMRETAPKPDPWDPEIDTESFGLCAAQIFNSL